MAVSLIARKYNSYYAQRPVLTTMITNAVCVLVARLLASPVHYTEHFSHWIVADSS